MKPKIILIILLISAVICGILYILLTKKTFQPTTTFQPITTTTTFQPITTNEPTTTTTYPPITTFLPKPSIPFTIIDVSNGFKINREQNMVIDGTQLAIGVSGLSTGEITNITDKNNTNFWQSMDGRNIISNSDPIPNEVPITCSVAIKCVFNTNTTISQINIQNANFNNNKSVILPNDLPWNGVNYSYYPQFALVYLVRNNNIQLILTTSLSFDVKLQKIPLDSSINIVPGDIIYVTLYKTTGPDYPINIQVLNFDNL